VALSRTVERGKRDPSLQGRMYGVSGIEPPNTGPDLARSSESGLPLNEEKVMTAV